MLIPTVPGAVPWPAAIIVWGPGYQSAEHRHHCVQLVLTLRATLRIRARSTALWTECGAALVRSNVPHEVDARDTPVLIGFVDPQSDLGAALTDRIDADIQRVADAEVARWRAALGTPSALGKARVESWVRSELLRHRQAAKLHPGVKRVLKYLRESLAEDEDLSLPTLARIAALSPSRFMHAFTESVGVPLRPYLLWLRLQRAAAELASGASVTNAAHRAGFSDSAHLTRTFRRMLGATPSEIARRADATRVVAVQVN